MDVKTARMLNLRNIIATEFGGNAGACADRLGIKRPQMSRWITSNEEARKRGISEDSARTIEQKLGKPHGSLDLLPGENIQADVPAAAAVAEFAWLFHNTNDEGRDYLCNAIKVARLAFPPADRRGAKLAVANDRRKS